MRTVRIPRIAQLNYTIRTTAFGYCFVVMALLFWERHMGLGAWALLALQFLAYPHLVWLRARYSRNPRRTELQNLYLDPLLLGVWMAMVGFPTWVTYAAVFSTALNNATMRGVQGAVIAVGCFTAGALAWVVPMGYTHFPQTSALVSALCFFGSLAYSCGVGVVVFNQNRRMQVARDEMRAGEQRYRLITEHAADLVAMVDRDARWLYVSPSYGRVLAQEDLALGADAFRRVHEEDQLRVRGAIQSVMATGETYRLRLRLHTLDGDVRRFEALVHAVKEGGDPATGAVIASRDVTELRDREEQLEVAAHAFERMADAMVITNAAGRVLTINQSFSRITGYPSEEVIGHHESEFHSAMQPKAFYDDLYAEVLRNGHWSGTTWCRRRDGTVYREWRSVSAVRDADEKITHFVSLFRELNGSSADARPARSA